MTNSLPITTPDSQTCATSLLDALLEQDSRRSQILAQPAQHTDDLVLVGLGRMYLSKDGNPAQDPSTYHLWMTDMDGIVEAFRAGRTIGEKHNQPCVTMAWPVVAGSSKMANCGGVMWGVLDIDEDMDDAKVELLKRYFAPWGHYIFTSASHDPLGIAGPSKYRVKVMFFFDRNVTYAESAWVMWELALEVAEYVGIDLVNYPKAIDPCCKRAMQPQLIPAHKSAAIMAQSWDHYQPGPAVRISERVKRAQARIVEAEKIKEEKKIETQRRKLAMLAKMGANAHASAMTNPSFAATGNMDWPEVAQGYGIDREAGAFAEISALGIHPGRGTSNKDLYRAAWICREWALDSTEARRVFDQCFAGVYEPRRLDQKIESCYGQGANSSDGKAIERVVGARDFNIEDGFSFDTPVSNDSGICAETNYGVKCVLSQAPTEGSEFLAQHTSLTVESEDSDAPAVGPLLGANPLTELITESRVVAPIKPSGKKIHQPKLDPIASYKDLPARVFYVKSPCGTGKNYTLRGMFESLADEGKDALGLVHRQSLAWSVNSSYPSLACYLEEGTVDKEGGITGSAVVCLDSLEKVRLSIFENSEIKDRKITVVLLDEVEQLARHMVGQTLKQRHRIGPVYKALSRILQSADYIICQDADLSMVSVRFIRDLMEWTEPHHREEFALVNTWRDTDRTANVYSSEMQLVDKLIEVGADDRVWCYSTGRNGAAAAHLAYTRAHPGKRAILLDRYTSTTPAAAALLSQKTPAEAQAAWASYDAVFCTGTVGTGVSVEVPFHVFGLCSSGAGPIAQDVKQGLHRVRGPIAKQVHLFIGGPARFAETNSEIVQSNMRQNSKEARQFLKDLDKEWKQYVDKAGDKDVQYIAPEDPQVVSLACDVEAQRARWGNHFADHAKKDPITGLIKEVVRGPLLVHLESCGFQLNPVAPPAKDVAKAMKKQMEALRKEVKVEKAKRGAASPLYTLKEALDEFGRQGTPEAEAVITKATIVDFHGPVVRPAVTVDQILQDRDGAYQRQCRTLAKVIAWQSGNKAAVAALDAEDADTGLSVQISSSAVQTRDLVALLRVFGIADLRTMVAVQTPLVGNPEVIKALATVYRDRFERTLRVNLGKGYIEKPVTLIQMLLDRMALKTTANRVRNKASFHTIRQDVWAQTFADAQQYLKKITTPVAAPLLLEEATFEHISSLLED